MVVVKWKRDEGRPERWLRERVERLGVRKKECGREDEDGCGCVGVEGRGEKGGW